MGSPRRTAQTLALVCLLAACTAGDDDDAGPKASGGLDPSLADLLGDDDDAGGAAAGKNKPVIINEDDFFAQFEADNGGGGDGLSPSSDGGGEGNLADEDAANSLFNDLLKEEERIGHMRNASRNKDLRTIACRMKLVPLQSGKCWMKLVPLDKAIFCF